MISLLLMHAPEDAHIEDPVIAELEKQFPPQAPRVGWLGRIALAGSSAGLFLMTKEAISETVHNIFSSHYPGNAIPMEVGGSGIFLAASVSTAYFALKGKLGRDPKPTLELPPEVPPEELISDSTSWGG